MAARTVEFSLFLWLRGISNTMQDNANVKKRKEKYYYLVNCLHKKFFFNIFHTLNSSAHTHCILSAVDVGTRPKGEKIPHEQQIKFFGKVMKSFLTRHLFFLFCFIKFIYQI